MKVKAFCYQVHIVLASSNGEIGGLPLAALGPCYNSCQQMWCARHRLLLGLRCSTAQRAVVARALIQPCSEQAALLLHFYAALCPSPLLPGLLLDPVQITNFREADVLHRVLLQHCASHCAGTGPSLPWRP